MSVFTGRRVAHLDGDFAVLLIGARINRLWKPHRWLPVLAPRLPVAITCRKSAVERLEDGVEAGAAAHAD